MSTTYNPISEPHNHMPPQRPGKRVVSVIHGEIAPAKEHAATVFSSFTEPAMRLKIGVAVVISIVLFYVLGLVGALFVLLLAAGAIGFLLVNRGHPASIALLGAAPEYYLVDIATHPIKDERRIQLAETGVFAIVDIEYRVSVKNEVAVVREGVTDVRQYLSQKIYAEVRKLSYTGTLSDQVRALRNKLDEIPNKLRQPDFDPIFEIDAPTLDVHLEGTAGEELMKIASAELERQGREAQALVDEEDRRYYERLVDNDELLMAEIIRPGSNKAALEQVLRTRMDHAELNYQRKLQFLRLALENGVLEGHQINRDYPEFIKDVSETMRGLISLSPKATGSGGEMQQIEQQNPDPEGPDDTNR